MKDFIKNLITIILPVLFVGTSNTANARIMRDRVDIVENMHFYVGAGIGYSFYNLNNEFEYRAEFVNNGTVTRHSLGLSGPVVGVKFQSLYGFGLELGYSISEPLDMYGNQNGELSIRNVFLDFMNYIPLAIDLDDVKFEILAGVGIGHMAMREHGSIGALGADDGYKKYGLRAKVGGQYNIDNHWSVRGLVSYQKVGPRSGLNGINSAKVVSLDVIYVI